jgi:membrane-associated phospholipid phosphatase
MHTLMSWLCVIAVRMDKKMPSVIKIVIWVLSIAIIIATQTLKQHYIIDLIVGLLLAEVAFWILKNSKLVEIVKKWFTNLNKKLKLE